MKINIIGGGIIGLFSAWYLSQARHEVHVFDQSDLSDGCSHGNAGMIVPSHFIPLAAPGVIAKGIRWMFDAKSPFYVKPRLDWELVQWLWRFYRSCNQQQAEAAMPVLLDFNLRSKKLFSEFYGETGVDFKLEERGILILYRTAKAEREELEIAEAGVKLNVATQVFDRQQVADFETGARVDAMGGVFYPADAHLHPNLLLSHLKNLLRKNGVTLHGGTSVSGFEKTGGRVTALFANGEKYGADSFVVAGGTWSAQVLKMLGKKLLLQDGKGYSVTLPDAPQRPHYATILTEAKVAVTPMGNDLRLAGTLELGGRSPRRNLNRVRGILDSVPKYFPDIRVDMPAENTIWYGYRPCSPDGLPCIGRVAGFDNLVLATGHAMMGLSLAPATGEMVRDIVDGREVRGDYLKFFDAFR